jgi:hypothetical protein
MSLWEVISLDKLLMLRPSAVLRLTLSARYFPQERDCEELRALVIDWQHVGEVLLASFEALSRQVLLQHIYHTLLVRFDQPVNT